MFYAEKLKKAIENSVKIKVGFGIVNFPDTQVKTWQELLECAKLALNKAKEDRHHTCLPESLKSWAWSGISIEGQLSLSLKLTAKK